MIVTPETPEPEAVPLTQAEVIVADAAVAESREEIATTEAEARVEVAEIEAARDVAIAETNADATVAVAGTMERITWLEGQLNECRTMISDLSSRLPLKPPETVALEATTPEGTDLTLISTSAETNETLTEVIAESADAEAEAVPERQAGKRRGFI